MNEFKLRDFYQAVLLRTLGYELKNLEPGSGQAKIFVFSDPENKADTELSNYWNRKTKVVARDFVDSINELKTRIYSS